MSLRHTRPLLGLLGLLLAATAHAEPYLAVANGLKCGQCHVNPSGGGQRTVFGEVFAQSQLPAQHLDTGTDTWTGQLNRFISLGGDLRFQGTVQQVPHTATTNSFDLEQTRVYLSANVIPERLLVYVDEQVAPGGALNREAWGMFWSADHSWYVKAGQMYLPFGLRLQDQSAFVLTTSGISMATPDKGVEFGWEKGHWDAQLAVSNGTAGGSTNGNGKQTSLQASYVEARWRLGLAANINDSDPSGSRTAYAAFAGLKTGPIAWLGQAEVIDDKSVPPDGQKQLAGLIEANYSPARGHNIKLTAEYLDPNRHVANDQQTRYSLVYEYTPIQFLQIRGGFRYNDGIPQADAQHLKLYFIELHGFF
ncbi:MAG: hypothetical protein JSR36_07145 [Proteobacteria bacterium]|nr:hypothetical protein [Pseudomonadota bacterium]